MFQALSEAAVDAKLTTLRSILLKKDEPIIEYSNRILKLVSELECAGCATSRIEQKPVLLCGLPTQLIFKVELVLRFENDLRKADSKLVP